METTQVFFHPDFVEIGYRLVRVAERWEQALVEFACCHWELPIDPECGLCEKSLSTKLMVAYVLEVKYRKKKMPF